MIFTLSTYFEVAIALRGDRGLELSGQTNQAGKAVAIALRGDRGLELSLYVNQSGKGQQ